MAENDIGLPVTDEPGKVFAGFRWLAAVRHRGYRGPGW
jgi:hypothetical protein